MVAFLLDKGADINCTNSAWSTPLHGAAWKGHLKVTELLVIKGAATNARDQNDQTPLDVAVEQKHLDVAKVLENHGGLVAVRKVVNAGLRAGAREVVLGVERGLEGRVVRSDSIVADVELLAARG